MGLMGSITPSGIASPGATTDDGRPGAPPAVAAAAFMPTVLSLDPSVLEVDTFSDLAGVRHHRGLRGPNHLRWRASPRADMRFVAVTLPACWRRPGQTSPVA
jgi:type VI secretion system protein ImpD/type VI secretion system protein ImpC